MHDEIESMERDLARLRKIEEAARALDACDRCNGGACAGALRAALAVGKGESDG